MNSKKMDRIFEQIALKNGVTKQEVIRSIQQAIDAAMDTADPQTLALWLAIPRRGDRPSPAEFVAYMAVLVKNKDHATLAAFPALYS